MDIEPIPRAEWSSLPRSGCVNVKGKVLLRLPSLTIATLRFGLNGTIDEHSAPYEIDVICLDGRGTVSIEGESQSIAEGQRVRWPANLLHRLWTDGESMTALMVEHLQPVSQE